MWWARRCQGSYPVSRQVLLTPSAYISFQLEKLDEKPLMFRGLLLAIVAAHFLAAVLIEVNSIDICQYL